MATGRMSLAHLGQRPGTRHGFTHRGTIGGGNTHRNTGHRATGHRPTGGAGGAGGDAPSRSTCLRAIGRASSVKFGAGTLKAAPDGGGGDGGGAHEAGARGALQMKMQRARATMAMMNMLQQAPRLTTQQMDQLRQSTGEHNEEALKHRFGAMQDALPLITEVLQNVGDVFRGEEVSHNASEDLAKSAHSHDAVQDEVEVYSQLRKLVRLDVFSSSFDTILHAIQALQDDDAVAVLEALTRCLTSPNPGGQPVNDEATRQLVYFSNSLHNSRLMQPPNVQRMKSITSFTPYYAEDVLYTEADLYRKKRQVQQGDTSKGEVVREVTEEDEVTLLDLLQALFPDEWENFKERNEMDTARLREGQYPVEALRLWASERAQVLARTVRGVQRYGAGLRLLGRLEGVAEEELEWLVHSKFEYVVTCQKYGEQRRSTAASDIDKADAIDDLRREYAANLRVAFVDDPKAEKEQPHYSSVLLGVESESQRDLVLYKVRLPGNPIIGEGKPENQNHAMIFAHGEYLQTLDMNQDNYLGESFKMRNLLELFKGDVRIVGFPEHIFSVSGGAVAHFSGSNEIVFGSTVQRFLTWPLMVRFHYGHPDVWDKVWAISSGGVAKASRTLHVSEDIFGGFNVVLRGGTIDYAEFIHVGKGRDMSFIAVNGFESKISAGAAVTTVSRDMLRLMRAFDIFRLLSFYSSMAGFYVTTLQSMWSVYLMTLCQLMLATMGMETYDEFEYATITRPGPCDASPPPAPPPLGADDEAARRLAGAVEYSDFSYDFYQTGINAVAASNCTAPPPASPPDDFFQVDWKELFSFHTLSYSPGLGDQSSAATGLYDDSTVGEEPEKIITARYQASTYNSAMILHLGMLMMVPLFLEHTVQRSIGYAIKEVGRMFLSFSMFFYPFSMQTKGHNFGFAVNYGRAGYVATGRGYNINTSSLVTLFAAYGPSHIYFGMEIAFMAALYECWKAPGVGIVSTWGTWSICVALILAPWLFNPQALTRATLWSSWLEFSNWLYGRGDLPSSLGKGSWQQWAEDRLSLKRAAGPWLKLRLVLRNLTSKSIVCIACAYGADVPMPDEASGGLSGFLFHAFFFGRACLVVLTGSVYVATWVRTFEAMMLRMHRTRLLPLLSTALVVLAYMALACILLLFEHGSWKGVMQLRRERNVWVIMFGAITMQAGVVQALGALSNSSHEVTFTLSLVGEVALVNEKGMIRALAKHLKGIHPADIRLKATEGESCTTLGKMAARMTPAEERFAKKLMSKAELGSSNEVDVTDATVTIVTGEKLVAKHTASRLQNLTPQKMSAVLGDSLGGATIINKLSAVKHAETVLTTGWRARSLAYAQFWQRLIDQMMVLVIFATLLALSCLPILRLQTSILFNRQFADIINRKVHKQEVLDDLYTPGMFHSIEADETLPEKATAGRRGTLTSGGTLRKRGVLGALSRARGGPKGNSAAAGGATSSTKPTAKPSANTAEMVSV